ncbi:3-mercaptopyruvate sulfurtransferase [Aquisphaera giovannonii]|uniref:3-mercaptopyruvate sulfurtransferase n=1 Tax=Aquisphaera giovannonii TaxID=406548 RepID=A0A5B9WEP2_9BACT|nr:sulfurtransferase [Aquisphaera giovannonii]QEH38694.1 3-mercaptopyruvate sulfurtransferase [Aquisphaera giovannonii]
MPTTLLKICVPAASLVLSTLACPALADGPPAPRSAPALLSHDALQKRLGDAGLRILDARPKAEYEAGHIPGAVWVDGKAAQALAAKPGGLEDREAWQAWLAPLSIGPGTEVVVYDGKRQLDAARAWWLLRYLGVDRAGLLDGNFPLWKRSDRPVGTEAPASLPPSTFRVAFRKDRHATREDVLEALKAKSDRIIDARSDGEFAGTEKHSKRAGHIPGACHVEWTNLVDKDGRFLPPDALREKLAAQGVKPGEPVIAHCQGGGRASVDTFALERLGLPARNYYLGWSDWGNAEETPVSGTGDGSPK